jgi:hypothetical protein
MASLTVSRGSNAYFASEQSGDVILRGSGTDGQRILIGTASNAMPVLTLEGGTASVSGTMNAPEVRSVAAMVNVLMIGAVDPRLGEHAETVKTIGYTASNLATVGQLQSLASRISALEMFLLPNGSNAPPPPMPPPPPPEIVVDNNVVVGSGQSGATFIHEFQDQGVYIITANPYGSATIVQGDWNSIPARPATLTITYGNAIGQQYDVKVSNGSNVFVFNVSEVDDAPPPPPEIVVNNNVVVGSGQIGATFIHEFQDQGVYIITANPYGSATIVQGDWNSIPARPATLTITYGNAIWQEYDVKVSNGSNVFVFNVYEVEDE